MNKKTLKVAVIEDEKLLREAITRKLKLSGINVDEYADGRVAVEALKTQEDLPDVIWLDYYLPDMNGLDFMNVLSSDTRLSHIPVVVISNSAKPENVNAMINLGVKDYLLKAEYKLDTLIDIVTGFAGLKYTAEKEDK